MARFSCSPEWSRWIALALLLGCAGWLRFSSLQYSYNHPDEIIALEVSERVIQIPTLDTNWKLASLPEYFRYPQYNFSGYILTASLVRVMIGWIPGYSDHDAALLLRGLSAFFGTLGVLVAYLLGRQWFGPAVGLCTAALVATSPLLYQDSLYTRPEAFFTFLLLLALWIFGFVVSAPRVAAFAGAFLFGLLVATKISALLMLPLVPLAILHAGAKSDNGLDFFKSPQGYLTSACRLFVPLLPALVVGLVIGFLGGAPKVLFNWDDYIHGIAALRSQYTTGHWPHGEASKDLLSRASYGISFFVGTHGMLFFVFMLLGLWALIKSRQMYIFLASIVVLVVSFRFCSYPVFFERNLSHLFPILCLVCASGIVMTARWVPLGRGLQSVLALVLLAREFHRDKYGVELRPLGWVGGNINKVRTALPEDGAPVLLEFRDPGDSLSPGVLRALYEEDGLVEVGLIKSLFYGIPPSTLHTYFTPTLRYLHRGERVDGKR